MELEINTLSILETCLLISYVNFKILCGVFVVVVFYKFHEY